MSTYRNVLVAVDLTGDSRTVAHRALDLVRTGDALADGAQVHLLHVVDLIPLEPLSEVMVPSVQADQRMLQQAQQEMAQLTAELGLPPSAGTVAVGAARAEILRLARELAVDLIVIGARERHGLSILINRTEDTVMHGAPCDVLAVRMR